MIDLVDQERLAEIAPSDRVLLLPHCLRPSQTCPGTYSRQGLVCPEDCTQPCSIRTLRQTALEAGYKGVCIAPGGAMALRFVKQLNPKGIVAVACEAELELGVHGVESLVQEGAVQVPTLTVVPLSVNGCVDTAVDVQQALQVITGNNNTGPADRQTD